jgi:Flp pilus assembly protein TadG
MRSSYRGHDIAQIFDRATKRFHTDGSGSVAILFGLTILVFCGMLAFGIDYSRAAAVRSKLQVAVDSAVLAADPQASLTQAEAIANVQSNFAFNMKQQFAAANIHVDPPVVIPHGYRVTATADVPTTFGKLLGIANIPVKATAEAVRGKNHVEIALVLDNTASMEGGKLAALKSASTSLIDQIAAASTPGAVKYGLVPFSDYVNIGKKYRNAQWMSVPNDSSSPQSGCWTSTEWAGCPQVTETYACPNDGIPKTCSWTHCATPGPPVQQCGSWNETHTWNGCAGSRVSAPDVAVAASFSAPIPGILDVGCPSALTRLTTDHDEIKEQISNMVANGYTYIPSGIMWGWRVLAPDSPFADGAPYNGTKKIMILMTDGDNTKSQLGTNHEGSDKAAANSAMTQLCANVKTLNIELYTIAFEVTDAGTKTLLQSCASNGAHYYDAENASELADAFNKIAGSLIKLALSK